MIKNINIENNNRSNTKNSIKSKSLIGKYRVKVLSKMKEFSGNLNKLSEAYGFEVMCLSDWKGMFLDTLWSLFCAMMIPVKSRETRETECLLSQPCVLGGESLIHPDSLDSLDSPIKVNTVSPLFRSGTSLKKRSLPKCVPFLRLSGEWLLDYGFEIGKKYETYAKRNQLVLKIPGCNGCSGRRSGSGKGKVKVKVKVKVGGGA